jgi:hypothetical protein
MMEVSFEMLGQIAKYYALGGTITFIASLMLLVLLAEDMPRSEQPKFSRNVFVAGVYTTFWPLVVPFFVLVWILYVTHYLVKQGFGFLWGALLPK